LAADTGIEFVLATTDPNGNPTNGITRTEIVLAKPDVCQSGLV